MCLTLFRELNLKRGFAQQTFLYMLFSRPPIELQSSNKQNQTKQTKQANQPTNQPTNQPNYQTTSQTNNQTMNKSPNRQKTKQPNIQPSNQPTKQTQQTTPNQNKSNQAKPKQNKKETNQTNQPPNKPTNQPTHPPSQTNRQTDRQNKKRQSHRMKTALVETTKSFKWVYKNSICQILNEPNAALATSNLTYSGTTRTGPNPVPFAMYKTSDAKRDLNSTFFLESLGGTRAGRWKTTYLEKSHHTASSVASEAVQCPRPS